MADTMQTKEQTEVSEAQIAVHWKEEDYYQPSEKFKAQANMRDTHILEKLGLDNFPDCFKEYANMLTWFEPYRTVLDTSDAPFWKWFVGGKINACYNCVDRHLAAYGNKAAFVLVPEPEAEPDVTIKYQELYHRVNEVAALLRGLGLKAGDRVTFHMPMVPELPITMLACARLGIIHSQVFGGFSGQACGSRIQDSGSRVLITMDSYWRGGTLIDHKANADIAVRTAKDLGQDVDKVLVWQRYPGKYSAKTPMIPGRDLFMNDLLKEYKGQKVEPVPLPSEGQLFLMYSSGTTGKPKGAQHSIAGYLAYVTGTSRWILDIHPEDVYWCMADIGWITGHSYIVYGPLANAATSVLYEGVALVLRRGRQTRGRDHRHVVADRNRRLSRHHRSGDSCDEAGQLRSRRAGDSSHHLRRDRRRDSQGFRQGGQHLHPQSLAGPHADVVGRSRPLRQDLLRQVQQESP